ncbi:membrane associated rhomboid family serine protease [Paenibacillus harenae]|uniref:Membrane associated rhomboid family serine protease n=2 Tax=Paenibacillus harenae TaxID=306543 RepID=A0ABT9TWP4_PAEHA|nr:membrane associated rhomboid family serine protease [Paenibacillus harenae]
MMIFLRYESFREYLRIYPATTAIIALNIVYFIVIAINGNPNDAYHAIDFGAFVTKPITDPYGMEHPWRYLTSMFMHSGLEHLLYNMFSLLIFAPPLERLLRTPKYIVFYLLCGIAGNLASAWIQTLQDGGAQVSVGASGAIYGVFGAFLYLSLFRRAWLDESSRKTVYMILIFGVIYSFLVPSVDLWAHVGGGAAGFLLYNGFDRSMVRKQRVGR